MRVWDIHPSLLSRKHLLGQHLEIHTLLSVIDRGPGSGWFSHPETQRFLGNEVWLRVAHEWTRLEMNNRWPGRHDEEHHKSPVTISELAGGIARVLVEATPLDFTVMLFETTYPFTTLEHTTPWERDQISRDEYLAQRETYVRGVS